ncbi:MAG: SDR family oxidoreductase [Candidatus Nanopelagicaceae bacterium]|nr:SDR family oxidoreductase [Candidatus Nanopelagicaceae bacterium]
MQIEKREISLVTGAASGMGRDIAIRQAEEGFLVYALDVDAVGLDETMRISGKHMKVFTCDVSDPEQVSRVFEDIDNSGQPLRNYVAAAGIGLYCKFDEMTHDQMIHLISVNLIGVLEPARQALPRMKAGASMVFISSVQATHSLYEAVVYAATKGAVVTAARTLALEAGERGVRVNSIAPGTIDTPMLQRDLSKMNREEQGEFMVKVNAANALGRVGTVKDVSDLVSYLLSDQAAYVTASNVYVDGGFSAVKKF